MRAEQHGRRGDGVAEKSESPRNLEGDPKKMNPRDSAPEDRAD